MCYLIGKKNHRQLTEVGYIGILALAPDSNGNSVLNW
jgi:hypothetical protein